MADTAWLLHCTLSMYNCCSFLFGQLSNINNDLLRSGYAALSDSPEAHLCLQVLHLFAQRCLQRPLALQLGDD